MADITMCQNHTCAMNSTCYRYNADPNTHRQCYGDFQPEPFGHCLHYLGMYNIVVSAEDRNPGTNPSQNPDTS